MSAARSQAGGRDGAGAGEGAEVQAASPHEWRDPETRRELKKAGVWLGLICAIALVVLLIQPLLIIFAGLVFASMLDGGVRLLGKLLPIPRGWRLLIVVLGVLAFLFGVFYLTGVQIAAQVEQLRTTLDVQAARVSAWATQMGIVPGHSDLKGLAQQALGSVGRLTTWVGTAVGALTSLFMVMVIGLFVAMEPRIYDRGLQWMVPTAQREQFAITIDRMAFTMRRLLAGRLLGMAFEGFLTWFILMVLGVPMALVLGLIAAILAFIPNVGAFITGVLMTAVGFSAGVDTGLYALATYFVVQTFDGYVVIPMVAKRTVDLPPALTLSAQILASTLFGVVGLALADPMTAMIKVALERSAEREEEEGGGAA
ncbi:putative PurR-regulated permease PerM [Hephaestia caeni]|uniref:Putative PurR-regulated permease PerM n=1 Tax=Hephaestia caeni TaxID=645617 RepID=A0A397P9L0_9SPHN|nr:AI-2E family transporter [Hephaestia caeni]RIA43855.1 putative PurR-regulated permease PerM [Hephaestia caeni]